jgi:deoxycytidylate deaminase
LRTIKQNKLQKQKKRNETFMDVAKLMANLSECPSRKCGAVLVKENRIIMSKYHKKFSNETKMLMCWLIENKNRFKINDFSIELL